MAVAGRVAIVPKGDYDVSAVYKKLDLVRYNHNAYVAKKPNTGIEPTDEEYWMLMIENVGATDLTELKEKMEGILDGTLSVENSNNLGNQSPSYYATAQSVTDIVNGTTPAGNAKLLNGLTAEEFVNNDSLLINGYFKNPVNSSGKTEWTGNSLVCIDKWALGSTVANGGIVELISDGIQLSVNTETTANYASLYQAINKLETGKKYTFSVSIDGVTYALKVTGGQAQGSGTVLTENVRFYYLTTTNNDSVLVRIFRDKGSAVINWAKLEVGSVATPFIPPNKEVEKLKCGVVDIPVNKTSTDLDQEFYLASGITITKYTGETLNTPYTQGLTDAQDGKCITSSNGSRATHAIQLALPHGKNVVYVRKLAGGTIGAWVNIADGGNADTVDGYHVSAGDGAFGIPIIDNNYGVMDIGQYLDFHTADGQDFRVRVYVEELTGRLVFLNSDGTSQYLTINSDLANYLPLDGSVPMSGATFWLNNRLGNIYTTQDAVSLQKYNQAGDLTNARSLIVFGSATVPDKANSVRLRDTVNGVAADYTVLHTGNSNAIIKSATAPLDTTAIWIDTTNKKTKAYIDGAWAVMA